MRPKPALGSQYLKTAAAGLGQAEQASADQDYPTEAAQVRPADSENSIDRRYFVENARMW